MSLFYNPKTKKPQAWVIPLFIIVPIIVIIIFFVFGQQKAGQSNTPTQAQEKDIFAQ